LRVVQIGDNAAERSDGWQRKRDGDSIASQNPWGGSGMRYKD
jgi:hypothetical protein